MRNKVKIVGIESLFDTHGNIFQEKATGYFSSRHGSKRREGVFKISHHKSMTECPHGIASIGIEMSENCCLTDNSRVFVTYIKEEKTVQIRMKFRGHESEFSCLTWNRSESKFKTKRKINVTFFVPYELIGRYFEPSETPNGVDLILVD